MNKSEYQVKHFEDEICEAAKSYLDNIIADDAAGAYEYERMLKTIARTAKKVLNSKDDAETDSVPKNT